MKNGGDKDIVFKFIYREVKYRMSPFKLFCISRCFRFSNSRHVIWGTLYTRTFPLKQISSKGGKTQSESDKGAPGRPFCERERRELRTFWRLSLSRWNNLALSALSDVLLKQISNTIFINLSLKSNLFYLNFGPLLHCKGATEFVG